MGTLISVRTSDVLIFIGAALLTVGLVLRFFPGALSWFGNLPGDIRIQGEKSSIFIPITSMIVISVVLSAVFAVAIRLFRS